MLIGAGEAGRTLIQEIQNSRYLDQKICCVIDDNRRKIGRYILECDKKKCGTLWY